MQQVSTATTTAAVQQLLAAGARAAVSPPVILPPYVAPANGVALGMILAGQNTQNASDALEEAQLAMAKAADLFKDVGETAAAVLKNFPSS